MIATMFETDKEGKPFIDKNGTRYFQGQTQSSWLKFYPPAEGKNAFVIINSKNYI